MQSQPLQGSAASAAAARQAARRSLAADAVRAVPAGATFTVEVDGRSMAPTLLPGDTVSAERLDRAAGPPRLGDLVVMDLPGAGLVVHRLLWWTSTQARTWGDGSQRMDAPVPHANVLGRVLEVRRNGVDVTPSSSALRTTWAREMTAAAWHRMGRRFGFVTAG